MFSFIHSTRAEHLLNVVRQTALSSVISFNSFRPVWRSSSLTELIDLLLNDPPTIFRKEKEKQWKIAIN